MKLFILAIIASSKTDFNKLKEQKDLSSYHVAASPNYKVASREGHA